MICINQKSKMKKLKFSKKNIKIYNFLKSKKKDIKILKGCKIQKIIFTRNCKNKKGKLFQFLTKFKMGF
jgi:hypothetical protein